MSLRRYTARIEWFEPQRGWDHGSRWDADHEHVDVYVGSYPLCVGHLKECYLVCSYTVWRVLSCYADIGLFARRLFQVPPAVQASSSQNLCGKMHGPRSGSTTITMTLICNSERLNDSREAATMRICSYTRPETKSFSRVRHPPSVGRSSDLTTTVAAFKFASTFALVIPNGKTYMLQQLVSGTQYVAGDNNAAIVCSLSAFSHYCFTRYDRLYTGFQGMSVIHPY